jgi:hypothetical protein
MHEQAKTQRSTEPYNPDWSSWPAREERGAVSERFIQGVRQGPGTCWHANGRKAWEGVFLDNRSHGWWAYWNDEGDTIALVEYAHGHVVRTLRRDADILAAAVADV